MSETKSLNESIISIRVKLQNAKLKKSGFNKFAGFNYFELADFLPKLNELMLEEKVNDQFSIDDGKASLTLIKGLETQTYTVPFVMFETPLNQKGAKSMQDIQYLGALNTYYKRYLYLNAFGITDGDVIDAMDNGSEEQKASPKQIEMLKKAYVGENMMKLLKSCNIEKIEDMSKAKASELIGKIMEKRGAK